MSRTVLLALALLALVCAVSAHGGHRRGAGGMPNGWKNKRAVSASTCSFYQCAVQDGSCDLNNGKYCSAGQHCKTDMKCYNNVAIGGSCSINAIENECAQGSCVDTGNGATCQYFRELMPGNPCSVDTECYFSSSADGSGANSGSCTANKVCFGKQIGESCLASHQCVLGSFCTDGTCKPLSTEGQSCNSNADVTGCSSEFTCLENVCSRRYTRSQGQTCSTTLNCQAGLFCSSSKTCTKAATTSSNTACDISGSTCAATEECSCKSYTTQGQTATCNAIKGTYSDMPALESSAYKCLADHGCNADTANTTNVACIKNNCAKEYCSYFTRNVNEIYSDYPSCVVSRMVETQDYYSLLMDTCSAYKPVDTPVSSASLISASFALVAFTIFFFAL